MASFGNNSTKRATGYFHGVESTDAGREDAANRAAAQRAFGATGNVDILRGDSVPDGDTLSNTLNNSNGWNYGQTRGDRGDIASMMNANRRGGRNNKSKRRKIRKGKKSKKRRFRKTTRRRR
jgi:hypothetical protein